MKLDDLMGYVVDRLYAGLTGGSAELPLPENVTLNFLQPGVPFHESFFDFAIAGPYAGPTPQTLDDFRELVETLMGPGTGEEGTPGAEGGMDRAVAIEEAKRMYQQHLLGSWEQWSRLVDFIPLVAPTPEQTRWGSQPGQGRHGHVSVVYGQAGQELSRIYMDTLRRCEVADEPLTPEQEKLIERMRLLLEEQVEEEDFLTGETKIVSRESRAMIVYKEKKNAYENAVTDYAARLARANGGTAADLIEWQRSGGMYRRRAIEARRDWIATGYKNDVERAQATLSHILGSSMVQWKDNLLQIMDDIEDNTTGAFGYPFYPSSVIPGGFARSSGWSRFEERSLSTRMRSSASSSRTSGAFGLSLGLFNIGGGGSRQTSQMDSSFTSDDFGMEFSYTTVEIMRPYFNPDFFLSRGWKPNDSFVRDRGKLHSDGEKEPKGAMIGYPTKALFVKDLVIYSMELASLVKSEENRISGGGAIGWGPFMIGGNYQQANRKSERNFDLDTSAIRVNGLQLVGFMSALFPYTANPSPDVTRWI